MVQKGGSLGVGSDDTKKTPDEFVLKDGIWRWQEEKRRPHWDEMFMMIAEVAATRSTCDRGPKQRFREHKGTGAVIASMDNRQIAIGYNGSPPGVDHCDDIGHRLVDGHCVATIHAEENAILNATFDLKGCKIYTTTIPCFDCCKRIIAVGIVEVIFQHCYTSRYDSQDLGLALLRLRGVLSRRLTI